MFWMPRSEDKIDLFDVAELLKNEDLSRHIYHELFCAQTLSLGLAVWPAGTSDEQRPHAEDEVYYVVEGRGHIRVADEEQSVGAGSVIFVAANVEHQFFEIEDTLKVVVFWAPPHHSREGARG